MAHSDVGLSVEKVGTEARPIFKLIGSITGDSTFPLHLVGSHEAIILDLADVKRINSSGIRLWIQWMEAIRRMQPQSILIWQRASRVMIDQLNRVFGLMPPPFFVQSIHVPYVCEACQREQVVLLERGTHFHEAAAPDGATNIPTVSCSQCGQRMEPDIIANSFFHFLNKVKEGLEQTLI